VNTNRNSATSGAGKLYTLPTSKGLPRAEQPFLTNWVVRSLSLSYFNSSGNYRNERTVVTAFLKQYGAINQRKQRVVFAHTHVGASVVLGAALTHDDVASDEGLTTEDFHAEAFAMRFTAVV
jgi:hypothetical protein